MLKTYQFKLTVRASVITLKLQLSFLRGIILKHRWTPLRVGLAYRSQIVFKFNCWNNHHTEFEGLVFRGHPHPNPVSGAQALPNFGGSLISMRTPFEAEPPNLTCMATHEEGACLRKSATAPSQRGGAPAHPNFWGSPVSVTTLFKEEL